ncbi:MAG: tyrosine-type recombinase/integrase [Planctomycetaceae bacterium]|nr:tyrosine-type recombinase/integrase [Planctomycetaceae bacterium]
MASLYKKPVLKIDPKTGEKTKTVSKKWWGQYRNAYGQLKRVPLAIAKVVAQKMLNDIVNRVEREKAGIIDPAIDEIKRPIEEHIADFEKHQKAKNCTPGHVNESVRKVRRCVTHCRWSRLSQIKAVDVENFLLHLRENEGMSVGTSNHYLWAIKTFVHWLLATHRINLNPFIGVRTLNTKADRRHDRRALNATALAMLLDAAETGPTLKGLTGPDRAMLYLLAAYTGLRKGEIGSLTVRSFRLDTQPCTVTVQAAYSKHRREDVLILHPSLVERLKAWLTKRKPKTGDEILFPISKRTCGIIRSTSELLQSDLATARRYWIDEVGDPAERQKREASDFLMYQNGEGKFADFHGLRHTFITNLGKAKVSPKVAQTLARHSDISLTMNVYTHIEEDEQIDAINALPSIPDTKKSNDDGVCVPV